MSRPADGEREVVGYSLLTARILHLTHAAPPSLAYLFFFSFTSDWNPTWLPLTTDNTTIRYSVLHICTSELSHRYGGRGVVVSGFPTRPEQARAGTDGGAKRQADSTSKKSLPPRD